jgi:hypothetical protein
VRLSRIESNAVIGSSWLSSLAEGFGLCAPLCENDSDVLADMLWGTDDLSRSVGAIELERTRHPG